jgi:cell division protease FtsH
MVMEFGMSKLGPMNFGPQMDITEWGKSMMDQPSISPEMQSKIYSEVQELLGIALTTAQKILKTHKKQLDMITEELVKHETIEGDGFEKLMGKKV